MAEFDPNKLSIDDGLELPSEYGQSTPEPVEDISSVPISVRSSELFTESGFKAFGDEFLMINDIILSDVPLSAITIESTNNVFVAETLRSQAPIVTSNGIQDWIVSLSLNFPPGQEQSSKLHRLISQLAKHPLVFIFNGRIRGALNITDPSVTTMFILESGNLRNAPDSTSNIILDLTLHYFNYKPFSNHFWFNTRMPGYNQENRIPIETERPKGLSFEGYEASSYSLEYEAEKLSKELRDQTLMMSNGPNVPVNFPSASDTWMYYADHLSSFTPNVHDRTSDYIGFSLRIYEHHNPPQKEQRAGAGLPSEIYDTKFTYPGYSNVYNAMSKPAVTEFKTASRRATDLAVDSDTRKYNRPPVEIVKASSGDRAILQLLNSSNQVITKSLDAFSRLCQPRIKESEAALVKVDPNLIKMVQKVADRFPNKKITIYSGIRNYGIGKSQHAKARAIDFKVDGVSNRDLFIFIATSFSSGGAGYYPNNHPSGGSHFVHMDSRPTNLIHLWVDESGRGQKAKYNDQNQLLLDIKSNKVIDNKDIEEEAIHLYGEQQDKNTLEAENFSDPLNQILDVNQQTVDNRPTDENLVKNESRSYKDRSKWIADMAEQEGLLYYWDDPKVRNTFYKDVNFHIGSNKEEQQQGDVARNIVFSAVSVSFGHRVVPQKLASQDTYTWQFLGAGNRNGTMVFTFAGKEGRKSADKFKSLVYGARENARKFGSTLQDVGSIRVIWDKQFTKERNTIFALLDINNIVITDIAESSASEGADKHQLVVNFIVQDFAEEKFDKTFVTDIDTKKRIIKGIMDLLWVYKPKDGNWKPNKEHLFGIVDGAEIRDWQQIYPQPKYMSLRSIYEPEKLNAEYAAYNETGNWIGGAGRPYRLKDPSFPSWLAEILIKATYYCREVDDNIPPTGWKIDASGETWKDRYDEWGAGNKIKGRVVNIDRVEKNNRLSDVDLTSPYSTEIPDYQSGDDDMYKGIFYNDGGQGGTVTNEKHARLFNKWINKMNILVQDVRSHITDEENFSKYFGTLGDEMMKSITSDLGGCYDDMFLPTVPGGNIPLPPEFYIYDDSKEDATLSSLTDDKSMERLLSKHIDNEIASIERYAKRSILGGSYLSRNLPRIIEDRKQYLNNFGGKERESTGWIGEIGFMSFSQMMQEGTKAWQPVFYRPNDEAYDREKTQQWVDRVSNQLGPGDESKFNFMNNVIKLSPYLRDGHGKSWQTPYNGAPDDYLIETLYDEDWRDLSFGPNPSYTQVDAVMNGIPPNPTSKEAFNRAKERKVQAEAMEGSEGGEVPGLKRAVTSDGAVTVGDNFNEVYSEATVRQNEMFNDIGGFWKGVLDTAVDTAAKHSGILGLFAPSIGAIGNVYTGIKDALTLVDSYDKVQTKKKMEEILDQYDHPISSAFNEDQERTKISQLAAGIAFGTKAKDLSIRRAFPTFKIFLIEDDSQETEQVDGKVIRAFDDFYSYSAIQEIRISRSRKVAADLAVIRMTNIGGKLLRKRFGDKPEWQKAEDASRGIGAEYATGIFADTEKENPFERMILQDGVKIQIRLGYASNPDHLESVFLGSVVEIKPTENGNILEIVCQGFGAELEGVELGALDDGPVFYSSQQVLSGSIIQDSIVNFGRRSKFNRFNPGELRHSFTGGQGRGLLSSLNPTSLLDTWGQQKLYRHFYRYSHKNYPQDDNIFAPPPHIYTDTWERFWDNACTYRPLKQTPWQIFKEHELRHPGYISLAVPYGHSPRMTMFFGAKGQHYWSKPPSALELFLSENASDAIIKMRGLSQSDLLSPDFTNKMTELSKAYPKLAGTIVKGMTNFGSPTSVSTEIGKIFGRYRPFRNYHYFDSSHHILKNNIRTNIDGTYNEVEVLYFEDEEDLEESDAIELHDNVKSLSMGEEGIFACKLDENIPEEYIRSYREEFPSCVTEFMAKRYTQGLFARLLRDSYKGDLCVLGEPTLKPYDICYLSDTSINMSGPVEVEAVEHIINRDHGFISIITPDLCVDINDMYSASVFDVTGAALAYTFGINDPDTVSALSQLASPLGFLAITGGVKFMMWMQEGTPVVTTPLTLEGKPFMSVALGQKRTSLVLSLHGKWIQYWDDLEVAWDKFDITESIFDSHISFQETLHGLFTIDPGDSIPEG